jgi:ribonuclease-3
MGLSRVPNNAGAVSQLELLLGFRFRDPSLFQRALTHRSFCNEKDLADNESYERMEFLGDAVLGLVVSEELYRRFPDFLEGRLTKARSALVKGETLAKFAGSLGLGPLLLVGRGVDSTGGREQESVLAAALEALVAAVYLDQGLDRARDFILGVMSDHFGEAAREGIPPENPKSRLQEHLQSQGLQTPKYRLVGSEGPDHGPVFTVEVLVDDEVIGEGQGGKKSEAEVQAARAALEFLQPGVE